MCTNSTPVTPDPHDHQMRGQFWRWVGITGGQNPYTVDRSPVGNPGSRTGRQDDHVGLEVLHTIGCRDLDLVLRNQGPGTFDEANTLAGQQAGDRRFEPTLDVVDPVP